ncbi:MAG: sensor histidine kinase [Nocardioidaceae bacterium]|nr:sensor histidine kinase [Nocardioidaceae bacterium]
MSLSAGLVAVGVCVVLAVRSSSGWLLTAGTALAAIAVAVVCSGSASNLGWFALCVLVGWCSLGAGSPPALWLGGGVIGIFGIEWVGPSDDPGWGAWIAGTLFTIVVCLLARRQRELIEQLHAAQASLAVRARFEERTRIAQEMHDVIGHALTVSLLHVASARLALDDDIDEARESLAEAERLGRSSLAEVRQAVGVLRAGEPAALAPLPGAKQLEELVNSFRRAGTPVTFDVEGDPVTLTATVGLTVYRILQEALTNVVRHAPGASAQVRLVFAVNGTRLTVANPGAVPRDASLMGAGILGMRERAEALGGRLIAGPSPDGWRLEAVLPGALAAVPVVPAETS